MKDFVNIVGVFICGISKKENLEIDEGHFNLVSNRTQQNMSQVVNILPFS